MKTETKKILKRLQEEANLYAPGSLRKELLLDAIKTIDALEIDNIAFGYVIQVLRRECGLSNEGNSVDCQEIYVYIDKLQKQLQEEKQKQREYEFEIMTGRNLQHEHIVKQRDDARIISLNEAADIAAQQAANDGNAANSTTDLDSRLNYLSQQERALAIEKAIRAVAGHK